MTAGRDPSTTLHSETAAGTGRIARAYGGSGGRSLIMIIGEPSRVTGFPVSSKYDGASALPVSL